MGWLTQLEPTERRASHPSNPEAWFIRAFGGQESLAGVQVDQETALSSSAVLQGVRLVSETVGRVPLGIYQRLDRGRDLLRDHPAYRVLLRPNDELTAVEVRSMVTGFAVTAGVGYAEIVFHDGRPVELWPIPTHRVRPERSETDALRFRVRYDDGTESLVPMDRMLVVPGFQRGGLLGVDVVAKMQESLGLTLATEKFGSSFFGNGSIPGGFVSVPGKLSGEARKHLRESLEQKHRGVERAHRIGLLEEGLMWTQAGVPPEAAQFLETRKFQVDEVARILNVPPHLLWHLERATFNNIEELGIAFVVYSLGSWWVRWEQRIAQRLLLPSEQDAGIYAKHNANELLRGSPEKRGQFYREMFNMGAASPNDIREWEDMNPVDGGDVYLVPMNMIPADQAALGLQDDPPDPLADDDEEKSARVKRGEAMQSRIREAHRRLFVATLDGVARREVVAVRGAIKKAFGGRDVARLRQGLDEALDGIAAVVVPRSLAPVSTYATAWAMQMEAEGRGKDSPAVDALARRLTAEWGVGWVYRSREMLEPVLAAEPDMVEAGLEGVLRTWEAKRAQDETERMLGEIETLVSQEVQRGA